VKAFIVDSGKHRCCIQTNMSERSECFVAKVLLQNRDVPI